MIKKQIAIYILLTIALAKGDESASLPKCMNGDTNCLLKAGQEVLDKYYKGNPNVNLVSIDPLYVKTMVLERQPSSPVSIQLKMTDIKIFGLKDTHFINFTGLSADLSGRNEFDAMVPELDFSGKYNIDGHVLVLPVVGNGNCDIKCKNLILKYSFDLKRIEKNGQIYAALEHVKLELSPKLVQFNFQNLFNGDKALGDNMNKFANENWKDIFQELKPSISKSLSLVVKSLVNKFFDSTPYADLFLQK